MTSHKDIGIPDAGQHHVDEEADDGVARQQGGEGQDKRRDGGRKREAKYSPLSLGCRKEMSS